MATTWRDPRKTRGFEAKWFPNCNGQPVAQPGRHQPLPRMRLQFLNAYYRINRQYARLLEWRAGRGRRGEMERSILQAIERALLAKESVEDCYASRGVVATPVYLNGFTIDVRFQEPGQKMVPIAGPVVMTGPAKVLKFRRPVRHRASRARRHEVRPIDRLIRSRASAERPCGAAPLTSSGHSRTRRRRNRSCRP